MEKLVYKFIWKSKDLIKRNYIINTTAYQGLDIIDIESQFLSLNAAEVAKILQADDNYSCNRLAKYYLNKTGPDAVFK